MAWSAVRRHAGVLLIPLILGLAIWVLHRELSGVHVSEILAVLAGVPKRQILLAAAFTAASYLSLIAAEGLAVRFVGQRLPWPRVALAGFLAYAVSNNLGFPLFTSAPLRFRLYSAWQVTAEDIARITAFTYATFWLGFTALGGLTFFAFPHELPASGPLPASSARPLGAVLMLAAGLYLAATAWRQSRRQSPWVVRGFRLALPPPGLALSQIVVSALDWVSAAGAMYALLPSTAAVSFHGFLALFLLAQILGVVSHVPGGVGVLETLLVLFLAPAVPAATVLGTALAFRAIYYLAPLALATLLLAGRELAAHRRVVGRVMSGLGQGVTGLAPHLLALSTFLGGVLLLASGATPGVHSRLAWLGRALPLPVIELSHFLSSLAGVGLLVLARGLARRLDAAYVLTAALLAAGALFSLLKGFDYEEALILALMLAALLPCRRHFYRRASLLGDRFSPGWVVAMVVALGATTWLGFFSYKHVAYADDLWWHFALAGNAPRFLRATVGAFGLAFAVAVLRLLRPAAPRPEAPAAADLDHAAELARRHPFASAHLALLGDKFLLWNEGRTAFVMYAIAGRAWISMGDPVGRAQEATELAWEFQELASRHGGFPVFYQVREETLFRYVDLGLELVKLGEEARVFLPDFTLTGRSRADLRQALRKGEAHGYRFELVPRERSAALLPALAPVSAAWLAEKAGKEKAFSLGAFTPAYLARCPLAVIYEGEKPVAFANLWLGGEEGELSVDLMRYVPDAPVAVMDYLFTHLLLWGKEQGFHWFNLGMAPLAGLERRGRSPLWNRLGAALFRHGETLYHFRGLRQYKDKFGPRWEPRYLVAPGGFALVEALASVNQLINGGLKGLLR